MGHAPADELAAVCLAFVPVLDDAEARTFVGSESFGPVDVAHPNLTRARPRAAGRAGVPRERPQVRLPQRLHGALPAARGLRLSVPM